ncbi:uncharacterized protein VTP21DRAFT_790 [Calcarisporiella thermophila]|uniref:uncharacterized protein n=1 Tax=Calcarisporiella thermophila TaxID=911321 RepID=UPI00374256D6
MPFVPQTFSFEFRYHLNAHIICPNRTPDANGRHITPFANIIGDLFSCGHAIPPNRRCCLDLSPQQPYSSSEAKKCCQLIIITWVKPAIMSDAGTFSRKILLPINLGALNLISNSKGCWAFDAYLGNRRFITVSLHPYFNPIFPSQRKKKQTKQKSGG